MGAFTFHLMIYDFAVHEFIPDFCSIGLGCFNLIFPTAKLNRWIFKLDDDTSNSETYDF